MCLKICIHNLHYLQPFYLHKNYYQPANICLCHTFILHLRFVRASSHHREVYQETFRVIPHHFEMYKKTFRGTSHHAEVK